MEADSVREAYKANDNSGYHLDEIASISEAIRLISAPDEPEPRFVIILQRFETRTTPFGVHEVCMHGRKES